MKNTNHLICQLTVITAFLLTACSGSEKGKWSEEDRQSFYEEMATVEELNNFGEKKMEFIECYLSKVEANYSSYAMANLDEAGCEKLAVACGEQVMITGSTVGQWSDEDKRQFYKVMEKAEAMAAFGDSKDDFIACYLAKCEAKYESFYQADQDEEGCEALALECTQELGLTGEN